MEAVPQDIFTVELFDIFEETFGAHHGIYLDENTALFDTLDGITADQASIPVGGTCASLAAQVAHVIFYMEVLERYILDREEGPTDWGAIWRTVEAVSPAAWDQLRDALRSTYTRLFELWRSFDHWDQRRIGGALAVVVHSAYHLGEIRQALCSLT